MDNKKNYYEIDINNKRKIRLSFPEKSNGMLVEKIDEKGMTESNFLIKDGNLVTLLNIINYAEECNLSIDEMFDAIDLYKGSKNNIKEINYRERMIKMGEDRLNQIMELSSIKEQIEILNQYDYTLDEIKDLYCYSEDALREATQTFKKMNEESEDQEI